MVVPTGNFGNMLGCYYAKALGAPIGDLVVATNANDILHTAISTGRYAVGPAVVPTTSPSMDIQVASNFERYIYHLTGGDAARVVAVMTEFEARGEVDVAELAASDGLRSHACTDGLVADAIAAVLAASDGYLVDPHTAVGVVAALAEPKRYECRLLGRGRAGLDRNAC